jgi:superfamily I DNA/RNA helicase
MIAAPFKPTDEQRRVIDHPGSAFIAACPGAGKTRVMVERARKLLSGRTTGRGIAFLSFTRAAVAELEYRLRREGLVQTPAFPHFIGTFDAFLWQFIIAPFGVDGCTAKPRLIPDKDDRTIKPFLKAQALPLECFDRETGKAIPAMIQRHGFRGKKTGAHETAARKMRACLRERGELDFADARIDALARLRDPACGAVLGPAFAARFRELIVDEAQDCNPVDLEIITWFRGAGVPVKVICDQNQAIYGFRGGVTQELGQFAKTFGDAERLSLNGNFRSSRHITKAIVALRAPGMRAAIDEALGEYCAEPTAVQILSYSGNSVPSTIGTKFQELVSKMGLAVRDCPVVSSSRPTASSALGHPQGAKRNDLSCRLAAAVSDFHFSFELSDRKKTLEAVHRIMLDLGGGMNGKTYDQYIADAEITPDAWRPQTLALIQALRFAPERFATAEAWNEEARRLLAPLLPAGDRSINQRLPHNKDLRKALLVAPASGHAARTIHSVKGMEFPAICVVIPTNKAKSIVDFLLGAKSADNEDARRIYVGASRAQRLLAIALPQTQAPRLRDLMAKMGAAVEVIEL